MNLVIQALFCLKNNFLNLKMIRSVFFPQNYFGGPCLGDLTLVFHQLCHLLLQEYLICINKWEDIWTLFSTKNQIPSEALPDLRAFWRGIDKKKKKVICGFSDSLNTLLCLPSHLVVERGSEGPHSGVLLWASVLRLCPWTTLHQRQS